MATEVKIEEGWKKALKEEFEKPYFQELRTFLHKELRAGKSIYPPGALIFNAFDKTPFDQVRVVILGQDPYHGPGQAMGLSFSVPRSVRRPPSLLNIYKELQEDLQVPIADHGDLTHWAEQGVFLLNAMLTVEKGRAGSHKNIRWQSFTDAVIKKLSEEKDGLVFLLWGRFAQGKSDLIDQTKHHVLNSAHPSPLARGGFFGCKHFSRTNEILLGQGYRPIDWNLTGSS
ncbi:MAG: uracil-DNA glycosylase [Saprospiraceae bacterium]|nr:uracil-DNA glycosylase [Saprospiraceae bacterium]